MLYPARFFLWAECARSVLLQSPATLDKVTDKFLVQSVALGDTESAMISSVATSKQAEAVSKKRAGEGGGRSKKSALSTWCWCW